MEAHYSWNEWQGLRAKAFAWTACLLLAWLVSTPVMAHGDEEHEGAPSAATSETAKNDQKPIGADQQTHHLELPARESREHAGDDAHNAASAEGGHDHSAHSPNEALLESGLGRLLVWLGRFHPAAVHFPIALLIAAALAELLSLRFSPVFFSHAAQFSLWVGALGAAGAVLLGWFYGGFRLVDHETVLTIHRWNGSAVAALALLTLWLRETRSSAGTLKGAYRTMLIVTALLASLNGYLGGLMVYGPEQHQWPAPLAEHHH